MSLTFGQQRTTGQNKVLRFQTMCWTNSNVSTPSDRAPKEKHAYTHNPRGQREMLLKRQRPFSGGAGILYTHSPITHT